MAEYLPYLKFHFLISNNFHIKYFFLSIIMDLKCTYANGKVGLLSCAAAIHIYDHDCRMRMMNRLNSL